jgi:TonB family protein
VNARESVFAEYLAAWKARMERLGTLNYPTVAGRQGGNPVLEVALAADGSLREVRVTRSSGQGALDQAAMDLVRLGTPYDPFPPACARSSTSCASPTSGVSSSSARARGGCARASAEPGNLPRPWREPILVA